MLYNFNKKKSFCNTLCNGNFQILLPDRVKIFSNCQHFIGYHCEGDKCVSSIFCYSDDDCPVSMQCNTAISKCEYVACNAESCKAPWHRCFQTNSLSFYICAPVPICTTHAACKETERCIGNHCQVICIYGKCLNGQDCIDNVCRTSPPCIIHNGFYTCDQGKMCNNGDGCYDIECTEHRHCKSGICDFGKCKEVSRICDNDLECPPDTFCEETNAGYKVCSSFPDCNKMCPKGKKCSKNGNTCIPIIGCVMDEECPNGMQCDYDESLGYNICETIICKSDKDCVPGFQCNTKKTVCEVIITYIECRTDKQCLLVSKDSKCIQGFCTTEPSCKLSGKCPPRCFDSMGCLPGEECYNYTCQKIPCSSCIKPKDECKDEDLFSCKFPYVCKKNECQIPPGCLSTQHCPCYGEFGDCPTECDGSALMCSKLGMICNNMKCEFRICTRDSHCPGRYCMNGQCTNSKSCTSSLDSCACFDNTCLREITQCPICPNGFECFEGSFCVPKGIQCSSKYHCPEHMYCSINGICKAFECRSDFDCSYGRRCGMNGQLSVCVPDTRTHEIITCTGAFSCPVAGMLCRTSCTFPIDPDVPCPSGSYYFEGECRTSCKGECPTGQNCRDGVCQREPRKDCSQIDRLHPKYDCQPDIVCYDDRDCPRPTVCDLEEQQCVNYCNDNRTCSEGFYCNTTVCLIENFAKCDIHLHCPQGKRCNRISKKCETVCFGDIDCGEKQKCIDMKCQEETDCSNCAPLQYCKDSKCIDIRCFVHTDCLPEERCKGGTCIKTIICKSDKDCFTDEFCQQNVCVPFPPCESKKCPEGRKCEAFGDVSVCIPDIKCKSKCFIGAECQNKNCVPKCGNETCLLDQYCEDSTCKTDTVCITRDDCPINNTCIRGRCLYEICTVNSDCPPRFKCELRRCVYKECFYDEDCGPGKFCKYNFCEMEKCTTSSDCLLPSSECPDGFCRQCSGNQIFSDGKCESPPICIIDLDCPAPLKCIKNECTFCRGNSDCMDPQICQKIGNSGLARCVDEEYTVCYSNSECQRGDICVDKKCTPMCDCQEMNNPLSACGVHKTCQQIGGGLCACIDSCQGNCVGRGKQCKDNVCVIPDCIRDIDCAQNMFCSNGYCTLVNKYPKCDELSSNIQGLCLREKKCSGENKNCSTGSRCQKYNDEDSICLSEGMICYSDNDCPEIMTCRGGTCLILICRTDAHCTTYRECKGNICVPKIRCYGAEDCDKTQICQYGYCYKTCESDCESGLECTLGACKA